MIFRHEPPGQSHLTASKPFERFDLLDSFLPCGFGSHYHIVLYALPGLLVHSDRVQIIPVCVTGNSTSHEVLPMRIIAKLLDDLRQKTAKLRIFSCYLFSAF